MRSCPFIRVHKGINESSSTTVYVPPPSSVMSGMARRAWLIKYFKDPVFIASKEMWKQLQNDQKTKVQHLVEKDGVYQEKDQPSQTS